MNSPAARLAATFVVVVGLEFVHLDDRMGPVEERLGIGLRYTQHRTDHRDGEGLCVVGEQIERVLFAAAVEQLPGRRGDPVAEAGDRPRCEDLLDEPAEAGVVGRFQGEERPLLVLVER